MSSQQSDAIFKVAGRQRDVKSKFRPRSSSVGDGTYEAQPELSPSSDSIHFCHRESIPRLTPLLWEHAKVRLCADGGANRVFDEMPILFPDEDADRVRNRYLPHVIKGDMDSIRKEVLEYYLIKGTQVVDESQDQDTNDLLKCIKYIFAIMADEEKPHLDLLPKSSRHEIHIISSIEGPHCGLIPVGMPSGSTTTTGLRWNLTDTEMKFCGLVSTSNLAEGEKLTVNSDTDLLWTISIKKP